jgi:MFS family permease
MAVLAPFVAVLADTVDRRRLMVGADVLRTVLVLAAAGVVLTDGPALAVYALAILVGIVGLSFRPAQAALLPSLATTPSELTAANVTSSTINSIGFFLGPVVAGLLLAVLDIGAVFVFDAVTFAWSAIMVLGVRPAQPAADGVDQPNTTLVDRGHSDETDDSDDEGAIGTSAGVSEGFRAILGDRNLRLVVMLYVAQAVVAGCSAVYEVTIALELLHMHESGVGVLNAALGIGGLAGGVVALVLSQRGKLAHDFGFGVALWAAPLLLVATMPTIVSALVAMVLIGIGNSLVDVNAETIIQRLVPDELLGRVFGALDGAAIAGMAIGAAMMPLLIETIGLRAGLAAIAVVVSVLVLVALPALTRVDKTALAPEALGLLQGVPMLAMLPEHVIERLARQSDIVVVPVGSDVFHEGDIGDRFYIIESGEVEVSTAGGVLARRTVGDSFGEIALLRDVTRTATVTALTDVVMRAIERRHFLPAVAGHAGASEQAELVVGRYMDTS